MEINSLTKSDIDRFYDKIDIKGPDECWEWQAATKKRETHQYGLFNLNGFMMHAHRIAWFLANGPIPEGKFILHKCDNPVCCNPHHLYCGTHSDNMKDRYERNTNKIDPLDYAHSMCLYSGEIWLVRKLYKAGITQTYIAKIFKTNQPLISKIVNSDAHLGKDKIYA